MAKNPLTLTTAEAEEIDEAVWKYFVSTLEGTYDKGLKKRILNMEKRNKGYLSQILDEPFLSLPVSGNRTALSELPFVPQEVIASVAYQLGTNFGNDKAKDLWEAVLSQDWDRVIAELRKMKSFGPRRKIEADHLEKWLKAERGR